MRSAVTRVADSYTGAAYVRRRAPPGTMRSSSRRELRQPSSPADLEAQAGLIPAASVFVTQLEQPLEAAERGLEIARASGVTTILNPAPGRELPG